MVVVMRKIVGKLALQFLMICLLTACGGRYVFISEPKEENPHGMTFEAEKIPDVKITDTRSTLAYHFVVNNAPPDIPFTLYRLEPCSRPLNIAITRNLSSDYKSNLEFYPGENSVALGPFKADKSGKLYTIQRGLETPLESLKFAFFDQLPGLTTEFILVSKNRSTLLRRIVIPYPLEASANDGARVSLVREVYDGSLMKCIGTGFQPNERLRTLSRSGKEVVAGEITCSDAGTFIKLSDAKTVGKTGGDAEVQIVRLNDEALVFQYEWGEKALKKEKLLRFSNDKIDADGIVWDNY